MRDKCKQKGQMKKDELILDYRSMSEVAIRSTSMGPRYSSGMKAPLLSSVEVGVAHFWEMYLARAKIIWSSALLTKHLKGSVLSLKVSRSITEKMYFTLCAFFYATSVLDFLPRWQGNKTFAIRYWTKDHFSSQRVIHLLNWTECHRTGASSIKSARRISLCLHVKDKI